MYFPNEAEILSNARSTVRALTFEQLGIPGARRSILLLFGFLAKNCSRDSKSNGIRMPDDREAGQHAPRSHAKFEHAPMQFHSIFESALAVSGRCGHRTPAGLSRKVSLSLS